MRITLLRATAAALLTVSVLAHAQQPANGPTLAQRKNCMACHAVAAPLMGPPFHAIADRYLSRADAADYLAQSIVKGSVGVWGPMPMPANTQLSDDEAMTLARWIMTLK